jgi:hypothetical protein
MIGDIEIAAGLTVEESTKVSPRYAKSKTQNTTASKAAE